MGIFSSGESKDGPPQPIIPPDQASKVRDLLGLTLEARESHQHLLTSREATQNGINYYKEHAGNITSAPDILIGELAIPVHVTNRSEVVSFIYAQINQQEAKLQTLPPDKVRLIKTALQATAEGYAQGAIEAKDWETAIKSFDTTTEGGIIQKPDIIKQLADIFKDDVETKNQMADLIESLIAKKGSSPTSASTEMPQHTPIPAAESTSIAPSSLGIPGETNFPARPSSETSTGSIPTILHTDGTPLRAVPAAPAQYKP